MGMINETDFKTYAKPAEEAPVAEEQKEEVKSETEEK